ncbi:MAG: CHAT domain-containing protein [Sphingobacteriaceae bacterium]
MAYDEAEYKVAQTYFEKALKIYGKTVSTSNQNYANCLNNLSGCYYQLGDNKKAADLKFKAIDIIERTLGKEHFRYISYVIGSTDVLLATNEYEKAYSLLNESKQLAKKKFGTDHDLYIRSLINQAYVCWYMNRAEESLNLYEEAISHKLKSLSDFFYAMNRNNQVYYLEEIQIQMFIYGYTLFTCREKYPKLNLAPHFETFFNDQLILKSLLNSSTAEWQRQITSNPDPQIKLEYARWLKLKNELNDLYKTDFTAEQQDFLTTQINDLETYLKKLVEVKPVTKQSFKTLKEKLKPTDAIIDISWYENLAGDSTSPQRYAALIIKGNTPTIECVLVGNDKFDANTALTVYNEKMESELKDTSSYQLFFKGMADQLQGIKRLYVSTKGVYNKINIETLFDTKTNTYVLDKLDVVYLPNLNSLQNINNAGNSKLTAELIGNPDFNYDFRKPSLKADKNKTQLLAKRFGLTDVAELPGTEKELSNISTQLIKGNWKVNVFTREKASEENLHGVQSPKLLHIATHGYFLKSIESDENKFLGFNTTAFSQLEDMRSGLILSGASVNTQDSVFVEASKDGILTAREASFLNLANTDLVVLSACQTGLAIETFNAGVIGLQQAFSNAGAKNLILSLWPVDDNATQLLMVKFYEYWLPNSTNENISIAFKKAQLDVKQKYPHPYYWGAFVLLKN